MTQDSDENHYISNNPNGAVPNQKDKQLIKFRALLVRDSVFSRDYAQNAQDQDSYKFRKSIIFDDNVLKEFKTNFKPLPDTLIPTALRGTVIPLPEFIFSTSESFKSETQYTNDDEELVDLNQDYYQKQSESRKRRPKNIIERRERPNRPPPTLINPESEYRDFTVKIDPHFVQVLKSHQLEGVRYMWMRTVSSHEGCILAHSMGLGKTLQTIVFVTTLIQQINRSVAQLPKYLHSKRILILAPTIALDNWVNEFERWLSPELQAMVGHVVNFNDPGMVNITLARKMRILDSWFGHGGILLMSYDQFRCLLKPNQIPVDLEKLKKYLLKPGPSVLIADEGHRIKNSQSIITILVNKIETPARVCLTGYPLQNNLAEYYHILDFASPGLFGTPVHFRQRYQKVIESVYADSPPSQVYMAKHALYHLHLLSSNCIHRKDASILKIELPSKVEYIINCNLLEVQFLLYENMLKELLKSSSNPLVGLILLRAICNHPFVFFKMVNNRKLPLKRKQVPKLRIKEPKVEDHEVDELDEPEYSISEPAPTEEEGEQADDQIEAVDSNELEELESWGNTNSLKWVDNAFKPLEDSLDISSKMKVIVEILKHASDIGDKVLIVSHSLLCLDYIEEMCRKMEYKTLRIDGSTPQPLRQPYIDQFNDDSNEKIMLLSARAGSIGVNIVGANRVILCDFDWNPCHEEQSIGRVYRYGQVKPVVIYRLVTNSTIEERLMNQSIHKRGISSRVIDNKRMTPQLEQEMKTYYALPEKKIEPLPTDLGFSIVDPIMNSLIEDLGDCIANIRLGDSFTETGFDHSKGLEKEETKKINVEIGKIRAKHMRRIRRKYKR